MSDKLVELEVGMKKMRMEYKKEETFVKEQLEDVQSKVRANRLNLKEYDGVLASIEDLEGDLQSMADKISEGI